MRALAVLPELTRRHEVLLLAGDEACHALRADYRVVRIPVLRYANGPTGKRSRLHTIRRNLPAVMDLALRGPVADMVAKTLTEFAPDVVMSDSEAWTHQAAARLGIPRISFDHFAVLVHCAWPMSGAERLECAFEAFAYKRLMGKPERMVIASFHAPPPLREGVKVVGPVLRPLVLDTQPTDGETLLVYFTNGESHYNDRTEQALLGVERPVKVYGAKRTGSKGNIQYCPLSNTQFVHDMACCHAIYATAGNQLISEAIHFRKPMLIQPEDALEQRLNASMIQRLGYGLRIGRNDVTVEALRSFLAGRDRFAAALTAAPRYGRSETVDALDQYARELAD